MITKDMLIKCPYCGTEQEQNVEATLSGHAEITYCDEENYEGACGERFLLEAYAQVKYDTYKIIK